MYSEINFPDNTPIPCQMNRFLQLFEYPHTLPNVTQLYLPPCIPEPCAGFLLFTVFFSKAQRVIFAVQGRVGFSQGTSGTPSFDPKGMSNRPGILNLGLLNLNPTCVWWKSLIEQVYWRYRRPKLNNRPKVTFLQIMRNRGEKYIGARISSNISSQG